MKNKKRFFSLRNTLITFFVFGIAVLLLVLFSSQVSDSVGSESERLAREAINRALITCYAAEGSYPASISHLEEQYGVVIDHETYVVSYEVLASNVMPEVILVKRK